MVPVRLIKPLYRTTDLLGDCREDLGRRARWFRVLIVKENFIQHILWQQPKQAHHHARIEFR
jgi:hypothetical protein